MLQVTTMVVWNQTIEDGHLQIMNYRGYICTSCLDFPAPKVHFLIKDATPEKSQLRAWTVRVECGSVAGGLTSRSPRGYGSSTGHQQPQYCPTQITPIAAAADDDDDGDGDDDDGTSAADGGGGGGGGDGDGDDDDDDDACMHACMHA